MAVKTEAQRRAQQKYMESFAVARVRIPIAEYENIKVHAEATGESVNSFFCRAASETMARDKQALQSHPTAPGGENHE